jgi:hypothetical protein
MSAAPSAPASGGVNPSDCKPRAYLLAAAGFSAQLSDIALTSSSSGGISPERDSTSTTCVNWQRIRSDAFICAREYYSQKETAMDEFEVELRITQLEKAYAIATNALHRARVVLQGLRSDPGVSATLVERAQRRCDELVRRREGLRFTLEELETQSERVQ